MAVFTCEKCGKEVETRCKPKKCPACSESGVMCKVEAPKPAVQRRRSKIAGGIEGSGITPATFISSHDIPLP